MGNIILIKSHICFYYLNHLLMNVSDATIRSTDVIRCRQDQGEYDRDSHLDDCSIIHFGDSLFCSDGTGKRDNP
jgi:hypothetical protein